MSTISSATIQSQLPYVERLLASHNGDINLARKELKDNRQVGRAFEACVGQIRERKDNRNQVPLFKDGMATSQMVALHSSAPKNQRLRFGVNDISTTNKKADELYIPSGLRFNNSHEFRILLKKHFREGDAVEIQTEPGGEALPYNLNIQGSSTHSFGILKDTGYLKVSNENQTYTIDCANGLIIKLRSELSDDQPKSGELLIKAKQKFTSGDTVIKLLQQHFTQAQQVEIQTRPGGEWGSYRLNIMGSGIINSTGEPFINIQRGASNSNLFIDDDIRIRAIATPSSTDAQPKTGSLSIEKEKKFPTADAVREILSQHFSDGDQVRIQLDSGETYEGKLDINSSSTFLDKPNRTADISLIGSSVPVVDCFNGATIEKILG